MTGKILYALFVFALAVFLDICILKAVRKWRVRRERVFNDVGVVVKYFSMNASTWLKWFKHHSWLASFPFHYYTFTILYYAILPPALIFQERWLFDQSTRNNLKIIACNIDLLCQKRFPEYFLVIFSSFFILLALVLIPRNLPENPDLLITEEVEVDEDNLQIHCWQTRFSFLFTWISFIGTVGLIFHHLLKGDLPGLDLALGLFAFTSGLTLWECHPAKITRFLTRNLSWILAFFFLHILLLLLFRNLYTSLNFNWFFALLPLVFFILFRQPLRKVPTILWIFLLALILIITNLNVWWISVIGDEYSFYDLAKDISQNQSLRIVAERFFNCKGVYGTHPYFSSILQSITVKVFGVSGFSWRLSSIYFAALGIVFFYLFFRSFLGRKIAITASLFLGCSHYLINFGKIGYNNLQAFFALSLVLWSASRAWKEKKFYQYAILGLAVGLCFYVYPAGLYAVPIPFLFLLFYAPPNSWRMIRRWAILFFVSLALVIPLLLQPKYWQEKLPGTFLSAPAIIQSPGSIFDHIQYNFIAATFSFLFNPEEGHFVASSFVDPISGVFVSIGLLYSLRNAFHKRFFGFWMASFLMIVFLAGATSSRSNPPNTRMFMVLPWFALFASLGLFWLVELIRKIGVSEKTIKIYLTVILITIVGINVFQANYLAPIRMPGLQSLQTLFLKVVQQSQKEFPGEPRTFLFITDSEWSSVPIHEFSFYYPIEAKFAEITIDDSALLVESFVTVADKGTYLIIKPWMEENLKAKVEHQIMSLGKVPCDINTTNGYPRFQLWHIPEEDVLCH